MRSCPYRWVKPLLLLFFASTFAAAQSDLPLNISLFSESTSIPFTTIPTSPVHPGIQLGTQFEGNTARSLRIYPAVNIGYLFHRNLYQGLYVNAGLKLDKRLKFGLNLKAGLTLGYLRTFAVQQEFRVVDGQLKPMPDRGNHRVMPVLSLGLGWRLRPREARSSEIFVQYQTWLEYPYSPGFIPLMSHTNLHLGTKLYPFN